MIFTALSFLQLFYANFLYEEVISIRLYVGSSQALFSLHSFWMIIPFRMNDAVKPKGL